MEYLIIMNSKTKKPSKFIKIGKNLYEPEDQWKQGWARAYRKERYRERKFDALVKKVGETEAYKINSKNWDDYFARRKQERKLAGIAKRKATLAARKNVR